MNEDEKKFYESVVHGLRSKGWSKAEAEDEAFSRVEKKRREFDTYHAQFR